MNRILKKGFTLLELMIAVAILSILAAIAYPSYMDQVQKTRRVDGKSAVLEVAMAEEQYYTKNKSYTDDLSELVIDAASQAGESKEGYYLLNLAATATTFSITATATGPQINDIDCVTMSMNQLGEKTSTSGGGTAAEDQCW